VQVLLVFVVAVVTLVVLYGMANKWARARAPQPPSEPAKPHATFVGGQRYATADETLRIETDGPSAGGEGVLLALVDALHAHGAITNPVEPEDYGYMTVVTVGGEDVILRIGSWGAEFEWTLYVESPSGKVAPEIDVALRSLGDVRDVTWFNARP
jgi:hypothetical protein